ncbi:MAG: TIGR02996 domain-containing protein, partial [Gemmataceae bacterium]
MDLHRPFLDDIRADPDDDGPRLIYADWLDEAGDEARAEFIRLQIARARGAAGPEATAREEALL